MKSFRSLVRVWYRDQREYILWMIAVTLPNTRACIRASNTPTHTQQQTTPSQTHTHTPHTHTHTHTQTFMHTNGHTDTHMHMHTHTHSVRLFLAHTLLRIHI